jgi:hypothetical protein
MRLEKEVHLFVSACERLLAIAALQRPLNEDEQRLVEYYCKELLEKLVKHQTWRTPP